MTHPETTHDRDPRDPHTPLDPADLLEGDEYLAGLVDATTAHITHEGVSLCDIVFDHSNPKRSRTAGWGKTKRRKPWRKWDGLAGLPDHIDFCGSCLISRFGRNPEGEKMVDVANDIRAILDLQGEGPALSKAEQVKVRDTLYELRGLLTE